MEDVESTLSLLAMTDLVTPMTLRVAATLRVADHVAEGHTTAAAIANATNTDAELLDRILRHLTTLGILRRDEAGAYALTELAAPLRDDHAGGLRAFLDIDSALGRAELSFVDLLHTVRTGEPAFRARYRRDFWDDVAADPVRQARYDEAMGSDVAAWAAAIVPAYDWGSLGDVVDVGGGNGTLLVALLHAYPQLCGRVFDQPHTATATRATFASVGLDERAGAVGGDFFEQLPPGAGGYMLTAVIHDWDEGNARAILRRCADAAGATGRVFVIEKIGVDGVTPNTSMDLRLLVYMRGRERTREELTTLAARAGLGVIALHDAGALVIVELAAR